MGQYRKRLEIIADILSVVRGGAKKTRIMYQANLSYRLLALYLEFVKEAGLVLTPVSYTHLTLPTKRIV